MIEERLDEYLARRWPGQEQNVERIKVKSAPHDGRIGWYVEDSELWWDDAEAAHLGWLEPGERPVFHDGYTFIQGRPREV